jgi:hypothetical protein
MVHTILVLLEGKAWASSSLKIGVLECWSIGLKTKLLTPIHYSIPPLLHYSIGEMLFVNLKR